MTHWKRLVHGFVILSGIALSAGCERADSGGSTAHANANAIGVAACDDYLMKYTRCAKERAPALARTQMLESAVAMHASWKQAAAVPVTKRGLEQSCQAALKVADTSMPYGCTW
ncbi:MAG TPA: hypothetical protein VI072_24205 [Polyangiaceae bacterium]